MRVSMAFCPEKKEYVTVRRHAAGEIRELRDPRTPTHVLD